MSLKLTSTAFVHEGAIPKVHTREGQDASPPHTGSGVPANAKSLVLIVDDPDAPDPAAPKMTWVHWVLYNIAPSATGLPQGVSPKDLPASTPQGVSDFNRTGSSARGGEPVARRDAEVEVEPPAFGRSPGATRCEFPSRRQ